MTSPVLLFLHGFLGRGTDWATVERELDGVMALAPDLPGHGAAVGLGTADYTMDGATDRLVALLDERRIDHVALAGYSMGGRLALFLALRHPERVASLTMISASAGLATEPERAERRAVDARRAEAIQSEFPAFLKSWVRMPLFSGLTDSQRDALVADRLAHNDPAELAGSLVGMGAGAQPFLGDRLGEVSVPTLFVAGEHDQRYVRLSRELAAGGPFEVEIVPNASHALLTEAPGDIARLLASRL